MASAGTASKPSNPASLLSAVDLTPEQTAELKRSFQKPLIKVRRALVVGVDAPHANRCFDTHPPVALSAPQPYSPRPQSSEMSTEVQSEAVDLIISAIDNIKQSNGTYEQAAKSVKETMDRKFGAAWHCIIGEGYMFSCTFQEKNMLYMYYQGNIAILLFKC